MASSSANVGNGPSKSAIHRKRKRNNFPGIRPTFLGDSHFTDRHSFPPMIRPLLATEQRFLPPHFIANGGARIVKIGDTKTRSKDFQLSDITNYIGEWAHNPQLIVIMLGTNNLRHGGNPEVVADFFRELVEFINSVPGTHLVICGLLPSCPTDISSKERFKTASEMLLQIHNENPDTTSFCNLGAVFTENGVVDAVNFKTIKNGSEVDVHLTAAGAQKMAQAIFKVIRKVPKRAFSFSF